MPFYNCHTHVFTFDYVPNSFLTNYAGRVGGNIAGRLLRVGFFKSGTRFLARLVVRLFGNDSNVKKLARFIAVGSANSMEDVFRTLQRAYPTGARIVVLTMNFDHLGGRMGDYGEYLAQAESIADLSRKFPDLCMPFLAVDPREGAASMMAIVRQYFPENEAGLRPRHDFVGLKMYPPLGYYPFNPDLFPLYEYAEKHGIPITTHCTRGGAYFAGTIDSALAEPISFNPTPETEAARRRYIVDYDRVRAGGMNNDDFCDNFTNPINYYDVLGRFPKLKLNLAHFGGSAEVESFLKKEPVRAGENNWYETVRDLIQTPEFPNVYTDISYTLYDDSLRHQLWEDVKSSFGDQILFGTDYFMTLQEKEEQRLKDDFIDDVSNFSQAKWKLITETNPEKFLKSDFFEP